MRDDGDWGPVPPRTDGTHYFQIVGELNGWASWRCQYCGVDVCIRYRGSLDGDGPVSADGFVADWDHDLRKIVRCKSGDKDIPTMCDVFHVMGT